MAKGTSLKSKFKRKGALLPLLIPAVFFAIVTCYVPMIGILLAFKDNVNLFAFEPLEAFSRAEWTLEHFKVIFGGAEFPRALGNTLLISVLKIIVLFPLPIIFAVILCEIRSKGANKFFQSVSYLPHFLSWAVVTGIFMSVFASNGIFNRALSAIGLLKEPLVWYAEESKFIGLVLFTEGWKEIGWSMIIYISAIIAINPDLYEAARVDGAGRLQRIAYIVLPSIKGTVATMFIFRICYMMDAGFDQIYTMLTPATSDRWNIIGTYVYSLMRSGNYTLSTAVGLFNSVAALILILAGNYVVKKMTGGSGIL